MFAARGMAPAASRGRSARLLEGVVPATCDGPSTVQYPAELPAPPAPTAARLLAMARAACAKADPMRRLNDSLHSASFAPLTADTTPLRPQPHCRGERLLWAASGIALAPFGPGLRHCKSQSVCSQPKG